MIHALSSLCRYGELQGLNKQETADRFGKEKVHEWRRSYDIPPPNGESLEMCAQRAVAYFKDNVTSLSGFIYHFVSIILLHIFLNFIILSICKALHKFRDSSSLIRYISASQ